MTNILPFLRKKPIVEIILRPSLRRVFFITRRPKNYYGGIGGPFLWEDYYIKRRGRTNGIRHWELLHYCPQSHTEVPSMFSPRVRDQCEDSDLLDMLDEYDLLDKVSLSEIKDHWGWSGVMRRKAPVYNLYPSMMEPPSDGVDP
jgi:hypothetical protein